MNVEKDVWKRFGAEYHNADVDNLIDRVWAALKSCRRSTWLFFPTLAWVKLSSMTSSEGDIGGVTFRDNEHHAQLFISQQSENGDPEFVISLWSSGEGITELWRSGVGSEHDRLIALTAEFEKRLSRYRDKARKAREMMLFFALLLSLFFNALLSHLYLAR